MGTIIFLDIDGVLNQLQKNFIDENNVKVLSKIVDITDGKIVLTSSWRKGYSNFCKCSPEIENLKRVFNKYNIKVIGRTPDLHDRAAEIKDYILKHNVDTYIILDDDKSEYKTNIDNLYIVNHKAGLIKTDIKNIERMIKK